MFVLTVESATKPKHDLCRSRRRKPAAGIGLDCGWMMGPVPLQWVDLLQQPKRALKGKYFDIKSGDEMRKASYLVCFRSR
jgi:hypothetical protein